MTDYVLGFAFNKDMSHVALIKKTKPAWQAGLLNGIGGKIEDGETGIRAMIREFSEECGIDSFQDHWKYVWTMGSQDWKVHVYFTNLLDITKVKTLTEEQVGVYDVNNILMNRTLSISNLPWIIGMMLDNDFINGRIAPGNVWYDN